VFLVLYGLMGLVPEEGRITILFPDAGMHEAEAGPHVFPHYADVEYQGKTGTAYLRMAGEDMSLPGEAGGIDYLSLAGKRSATPDGRTFIRLSEILGSTEAARVHPDCLGDHVGGACADRLVGRLRLSGKATVFPIEVQLDDSGAWTTPLATFPDEVWAFRAAGSTVRLGTYEGEFSTAIGIVMEVPADTRTLDMPVAGHPAIAAQPSSGAKCAPYHVAAGGGSGPCFLVRVSHAPQHQGERAPAGAKDGPDHTPLLARLLRVAPAAGPSMYQSRLYMGKGGAGNPETSRCPGMLLEP
jgi:hypothetical protein